MNKKIISWTVVLFLLSTVLVIALELPDPTQIVAASSKASGELDQFIKALGEPITEPEEGWGTGTKIAVFGGGSGGLLLVILLLFGRKGIGPFKKRKAAKELYKEVVKTKKSAETLGEFYAGQSKLHVSDAKKGQKLVEDSKAWWSKTTAAATLPIQPLILKKIDDIKKTGDVDLDPITGLQDLLQKIEDKTTVTDEILIYKENRNTLNTWLQQQIGMPASFALIMTSKDLDLLKEQLEDIKSFATGKAVFDKRFLRGWKLTGFE